MRQLAKPKMTVDEFLAWAEENPGRYELSEGEVYAMPPRPLSHAKTKFAVQSALLAAIRKAGLPCHMVPDGATVRVSKRTAYEPDALVYCGPQKPGSAIEVPNPVIVVEVLSPGTRHIDNAAKLSGYFALPSVCHYLIVDIEKRLILHHARGEGDLLTTRSSGTARLCLLRRASRSISNPVFRSAKWMPPFARCEALSRPLGNEQRKTVARGALLPILRAPSGLRLNGTTRPCPRTPRDRR
jgi:Uma2 family endonuclease